MLAEQNVTRRDLLAGSTLLARIGLIDLPSEALSAVPAPDAQGNDPFFGEAFIDKDEWRDKPVQQVLVWSWMPQFYRRTDPTYYTDFWTKPGYTGHGGADGMAEDVIDVTTGVVPALTSAQMQTHQPPFELVDERGVGSARMSFGRANKVAAIITAHKRDTGRMGGAEMIFLSCKAKERVLYVFGVTGDALVASGLGSELYGGACGPQSQ